MSSEENITVIESFSADDTHALGVSLGQQAKPGDVCPLVGDLGVGKTVLTQGIAEGLGITEPINSPTFTTVSYTHLDVYKRQDQYTACNGLNLRTLQGCLCRCNRCGRKRRAGRYHRSHQL